MRSYFHRLTVFVWTGEKDLNTQPVNAYMFFWKTEKKPPFSKISGYESTRPKKTNSDGGENVI